MSEDLSPISRQMSTIKFSCREDKLKFIDAAYSRTHAPIAQISKELSESAINSIVIRPDIVYYEEKHYGIKLIVIPGDKRCYPLEIFNIGPYEKKLGPTMHLLLSNCLSFVDIGSNAGYYSILCRKLNSNSEIHALEPHPTTFTYLQKQIALNTSDNVSTHQLCISDNKGTSEFFFSNQGFGNSSLRQLDHNEHTQTVCVDTLTFDEFVSSYVHTPPDFIKCDVEGAELLVLKGALRVLETSYPILQLELLRKWSSSFDYHPNDVISFLSRLGYSCFTVNGTDLPVPFTVMNDDENETNFFFVHPKSHLSDAFFHGNRA